jgi:hypothetical protein
LKLIRNKKVSTSVFFFFFFFSPVKKLSQMVEIFFCAEWLSKIGSSLFDRRSYFATFTRNIFRLLALNHASENSRGQCYVHFEKTKQESYCVLKKNSTC